MRFMDGLVIEAIGNSMAVARAAAFRGAAAMANPPGEGGVSIGRHGLGPEACGSSAVGIGQRDGARPVARLRSTSGNNPHRPRSGVASNARRLLATLPGPLAWLREVEYPVDGRDRDVEVGGNVPGGDQCRGRHGQKVRSSQALAGCVPITSNGPRLSCVQKCMCRRHDRPDPDPMASDRGGDRHQTRSKIAARS